MVVRGIEDPRGCSMSEKLSRNEKAKLELKSRHGMYVEKGVNGPRGQNAKRIEGAPRCFRTRVSQIGEQGVVFPVNRTGSGQKDVDSQRLPQGRRCRQRPRHGAASERGNDGEKR